jgi:hypothetical protein
MWRETWARQKTSSRISLLFYKNVRNFAMYLLPTDRRTFIKLLQQSVKILFDKSIRSTVLVAKAAVTYFSNWAPVLRPGTVIPRAHSAVASPSIPSGRARKNKCATVAHCGPPTKPGAGGHRDIKYGTVSSRIATSVETRATGTSDRCAT